MSLFPTTGPDTAQPPSEREVRHAGGGNCEVIRRGEDPIRCTKHDRIRGACHTCPRCRPCDEDVDRALAFTAATRVTIADGGFEDV